MDGIDFTPRNDSASTSFTARTAASIELVMVDGAVVARDGRLTLIDEAAILAEVRETVPAWLAEHARPREEERASSSRTSPRSTAGRPPQDIGMNRYAGDAPLWPGSNRGL